MKSEWGVTLMEVLLASSIGVVILLAMAHVDVTRIFVGQQAKDLSEIQAEPAFALTHLARSIVQADRVNLISPSNIQIRIPPITGTQADLNDPTKYAWVQYRLDGTTLRYFNPTNPCTEVSHFGNVQELTLRSVANNIFEITITSTAADPQTREAVHFTGQATMRAGTTNLTTGLLPPGTGNPPTSC